MKARRVKGLDARRSVARNAARILAVRLDELYAFDPALRDPAKVTELHDMRIAAKRVRYVLEVTGHCFGKVGGEAEEVAKELQGMLGEIHDCDVLIPRIRQALDDLRTDDAAALAAMSPDPDGLPAAARRAPGRTRYRGLDTLIAALAARRALLHVRFVREWDAVLADGLRGRLEERL